MQAENERAVHYMLTQGAPCFLPTSIRSPTIRQITFGGIHACLCRPARGFSVQSVAGDRALLADVACGRLGLFGRGGAGLYRRCVQAVQRGDSRRQPRHGLHGQEAIPAQSGLPGLLPARSPGCRGKTAPHQAVAWANTAQTQETPGLALRLANRGDRRASPARTRFVRAPSRRGARCDSKSTSLTNQRLRHNCTQIYLPRISALIHFRLLGSIWRRNV